MAVPDIPNIKLSDVCNEMNNNGESGINTLPECFAVANPDGFDPLYVGNKDRLSNFRNYEHVIADVTRPTVPLNLVAVDSLNWISVSWNASTDNVAVDGYQLEARYNNDPWMLTLPTESTSYNYVPMSGSGTYYFKVRAYDEAGNFSLYSNIDSVYWENSGGPECLVKGTKVLTVDGEYTLIEDLKIGYGLISANIEGLSDTNNVNDLYSWSSEKMNFSKVVSYITYIEEIPNRETINVNDGELEATGEHTQLVKRGNEWTFIPLENIKIGDFLIKRNKELIEVTKLSRNSGKTVYKLTLSNPYHTFFANGILTHNLKEPW